MPTVQRAAEVCNATIEAVEGGSHLYKVASNLMASLFAHTARFTDGQRKRYDQQELTGSDLDNFRELQAM